MAVHFHTGFGMGSYFDVAGANPILLSGIFNDSAMRKTNFVMVHGGWPFSNQTAALLIKPNVYLDYSLQSLLRAPADVGATLREVLELAPEKVLFATDSYPYAPAAGMGWQDTAVSQSQAAREALGRALTAMLRDGTVTADRAAELANLVLRENAIKLYGLK